MAMAAAGEWWEAAKATIAAYTGLPLEAFITVVAVIAGLYMAVSGSFARPAPSPPRRKGAEDERTLERLLPPVQLGEVTEKELGLYDGSDPKKPLLIAIKGQIYDVTQSRMFYGPGGPYALFAGRDASRALAKMSFELSGLTCDVSGLGPLEVEALQEWEQKFMGKYVKVGTIKKTILVSDEDGRAHAEISGIGFDVNVIQRNHELAPEENRAETTTAGHVSAMEQPIKISHVGDSKSIHEDEVEKLEETCGADLRNTSITGDGGEPKDAGEKAKQAPGVDVNSSRNP
ncbi:membrane steroid-binding protein 1 [Aegilops tauschii subsp. strangulata]|uniref:Cytochrome b5 heme-binding domain-containing protein n=1 Tax=Aegilops tauschii subsp. strangulata TaxID=200361 RepID=A0A453P5V3_AEGTS|nr:membrane steroid-binding protein 1 [Aegilops tauschii subsp. strangulata]